MAISGKWKRLSGDSIDDFEKTLGEDITKEQAAGYKLKIMVGCDSQVRGSKVIYCVALAMCRKGAGGLVYWTTEIVPRNKISPKHRLWNESYRSIAAAVEIDPVLEQYGLEIESIHCDLNREKKFLSGEVVTAIIGYVTSMGYLGVIKPDSFVANRICDRIVKR